MADIQPTVRNGAYAPIVERVEFICVKYPIGTGDEYDPIRVATAYYDTDGKHRFTIDGDKLYSIGNCPVKGVTR